MSASTEDPQVWWRVDRIYRDAEGRDVAVSEFYGTSTEGHVRVAELSAGYQAWVPEDAERWQVDGPRIYRAGKP